MNIKCMSPGCPRARGDGNPNHANTGKAFCSEHEGERAAVPAALPTDAKARKDVPIVRGLLDYFPAALAAVAQVSRVGNEQHNPGQPMHHARGKSTDEADCLVRHLMDRGTVDTDGLRHTAKVAWRALSLLQKELEEAGEAPLARGARLPEEQAERAAAQTFADPGLYAVDEAGNVKFTPVHPLAKTPIELDLDALKARTTPR